MVDIIVTTLYVYFFFTAHSRRGDLETLGYNLLQWISGRLPWEQEEGGLSPSANLEEIHAKKEQCLQDVDSFMKECFKDKKPPGEN